MFYQKSTMSMYQKMQNVAKKIKEYSNKGRDVYHVYELA